jgi:hypothetical protein
MHTDRLEPLRDLHYRVSWITEGDPDRAQRPKMEQRFMKVGVPPGTTIVEGYGLLGIITSTGLDLPECIAVAEMMKKREDPRRPRGLAEAELREAMTEENRILARLEAELAGPSSQEKAETSPAAITKGIDTKTSCR